MPHTTTPPPDPQPPRHEDKGEIGSGGMAAIHKVLDRELVRHVARKRLVADADSPGARARFLAEAQITSQLEHPNIVPVHDVGVDEHGDVCFTMKLVKGLTLSQLMRTPDYDVASEQGVNRFLGVLVKVCDAVSFAHSRHVVHRDLKPDNVMVGDHGQVYVLDWGLAMLQADGDTVALDEEAVRLGGEALHGEAPSEGTVIGTLAYMAPEQAQGRSRDVDARTDVFLLGGILYEALTRRSPHQPVFVNEALDIARACEVAPPEQVVPRHRSLPPGLCRIAMKALQKQREDRYQTVQAFKQDLETFLRGGSWFGVREFEAGCLLIREGDEADAAYVITKGECDVFCTRDGRRVDLRRMGPGEVFGEAGIFTSKPRSASVVAVTEVETVVVTRECLEDGLRMDSWSGAFVRTLAHRFRELDGLLSATQERLSDSEVLVRVFDHVAFHGVPGPGNTRAAAWRSLQASLGCPPEQVARVLAASPRLRVDVEGDRVTVAPPDDTVARP